MRLRLVRFLLLGVMVAATVALSLPGFVSGADDLDSLSPGDLLWLARDANSRGQYVEAARHARAAARRPGVGPDVLCSAWMNVFYAAHRTGDRDGAAAALRSFDESAARLPADDPVVNEMNELKAALGLGPAVASAAAAPPPEGDGFWQSANPAALGLDLEAIREHLALAKASGADAFLIAHRGKIVSEWYSQRYRTPMGTMSSPSRSRACSPACLWPTASSRWTTRFLGSCRDGPRAGAGGSRSATS